MPKTPKNKWFQARQGIIFLAYQLDQYIIQNDVGDAVEPADLDERKSTERPQKKISAAPSRRALSTPQSTAARVEAPFDTDARTPISHSSSGRCGRKSVHIGAIEITFSKPIWETKKVARPQPKRRFAHATDRTSSTAPIHKKRRSP